MENELYRLFDEPFDRRGTHCLKWDARLDTFGNADALPMWVADTDFRAPQGVLDALSSRVAHGAFGYSCGDPAQNAAVVSWMKARHGLDVEGEWIRPSAGVVDSLHVAVASLTKPGDKVVIQTPVYGPFYGAVTDEGRELVECPLLLENGAWRMDFSRIEDAFRGGAKMFLLCSPHNPVGRVWTRAELSTLVDLCGRYGVILVSDEIHSDYVRAGHEHICALSLDARAVQLNSATKTFNLAALRHSSAIIADKTLRDAFTAELNRRGVGTPNLMGALAQQAAYETGGAWLDALNAYIDDGRAIMESFFAARPDKFTLTRSEGTYLLWLDAARLNLSDEALLTAFVQKANVAPSAGIYFGRGGESHLRLNIATRHENLRAACEGIARAFD